MITKAQHERALRLLDDDMRENPPGNNRDLQVRIVSFLADLVVAYEERRYPIAPPTKAEARAFRKSQERGRKKSPNF